MALDELTRIMKVWPLVFMTMGFGHPELGDVFIPELLDIKQKLTDPPIIERNEHFEADHPLSVSTEAARMCGETTEDHKELKRTPKIVKPPKRMAEQLTYLILNHFKE